MNFETDAFSTFLSALLMSLEVGNYLEDKLAFLMRHH